jgi:hypothetical protein
MMVSGLRGRPPVSRGERGGLPAVAAYAFSLMGILGLAQGGRGRPNMSNELGVAGTYCS